MIERFVTGNYELTVSVATDGPLPGSDVRIYFSSDADRENCAFLNIGSGRTYLGRRKDGSEEILRTYADAGHPPWRIRLLKRGAFFRFRINDALHGYIKGPTGQWDLLFEPTEAHLFIDWDSEHYRIDECRLTSPGSRRPGWPSPRARQEAGPPGTCCRAASSSTGAGTTCTSWARAPASRKEGWNG